MYQLQENFRQRWNLAWKSIEYRKRLIAGLVGIFILFAFFPWFFQTIQKRQGIILHDWILNSFPAQDMSIPIFILIWASTIILLIRSIQQPAIFISFLWGYLLLCFSRVTTITLVPLQGGQFLARLTRYCM